MIKQPIAERELPDKGKGETATTGKNADSNTWYVGENVQTTADAAKAVYIRLGTDTKSAGKPPTQER